MPIQVLIVDDHAVVRSGFRALIEAGRGLAVVGEAGTGREAVRLAKKSRPDVVVMDVTMPGLNGVDATQQILQAVPRAAVLALSMHGGRRVVLDMLRAGATGYLVKSCAPEELIQAIRVVVSGKVYLSPEVAGLVTADYLAKADADADASPLTAREREVLQLVAEGMSSKEIASALHVTVKTIESHRHRVMTKLDIRTVAELTKYAIREGITSADA